LAREVRRLMLPLVESEFERVMQEAIIARLTRLDEEFKKAREEILQLSLEAKKDILDRIVVETTEPLDDAPYYKIYFHDND
jgi:hypothetical protein